VLRSHFDSNIAVLFAGAIFAGDNSTCTISDNTTFDYNNAASGAAVYSNASSTLIITDCKFSSNSGSIGTVSSGVNSTLLVSNTRFDSNTAVTGAGAISAGDRSVCTINGSQSINNNASVAAAVLCILILDLLSLTANLATTTAAALVRYAPKVEAY
jgi:predicted outer membrane repeat protein